MTEKAQQIAADKVVHQIEAIQRLDTFGSQEVCAAFSNLCNAFAQFDIPAFRTQLVDRLVKIGLPELCIKVKKWLNETGPFKDDVVWSIAFSLSAVLMTFTDQSLFFAQKLIEVDFMRYLVADLKHPPYLQNMYSSQNVGHFMLSSIGILHNSSKVIELREKFSELDTVEVLRPFVKSQDDTIRILSLLTIAHIIKEEENDNIMASADILKELVQLLQSALQTSDHRFAGFTAEELMEGLGFLAVNDSNKKKIMNANALPSLKKMVASSNRQEQLVALKAVSNLAFNVEVRATLQKDSALMAQLNDLSKSSDDQVKRLAASGLWVINDKSEEKRKEAEKKGDEKVASKKGHIMISYNWGNQDTLLRVRDALQADGYTVWMDVNDISGSTLQAMAEAVEGASLVLMCMSDKYKNSPNCRIEAEYAFQRQKPILPFLMQRAYKPDGWLGIMLGSKLFVDFSDKYPFEKSVANMLTQVKHMLGEAAGEKPTGQSSGSSSAPAKVHSSQQFVKWTSDDVLRWLKESGFEKCSDQFKNVDGKCMGQLLEMKRSAPEYFFNALGKGLCLQFGEVLRFSNAVDNLP